MMSTYTVTETAPRELAGKIASDLRQFSRHYGQPQESEIRDYLDEIEALLGYGYLQTYEFGYRRGGSWVMSYQYEVSHGQLTGGRPGGIDATVDIRGAVYLNQVTYSDAWWLGTTDAERTAFRTSLKIQRTTAEGPEHTGGHWVVERNYGAGGTEITRRAFRP
jgi:hypothetical protein